MKRVRRRERDVPANGCGRERTRIVISSHPDPRIGGRWASRCGAARKDFDNDHAASAARARRAMIARGVRIGCVVCCRRLDLRPLRGRRILEPFQSLVRPAMPVPRFISRLTSITNEMLEDAPLIEVEQHRLGAVQELVDAQRAIRGCDVQIGHPPSEQGMRGRGKFLLYAPLMTSRSR